MASIDLKPLVGRLSADARRALEAAAGLCLSRTHYNIEIEHWVLQILEGSGSQMEALLRRSNVDVERCRSELTRCLDRFKTGNSRPPALAPSVVDLAKEGWLVASLGFDPLLDPLSPAAFRAAVQRRAAPIKAVLLDQSFAAGVGNWIADEVLYQARIDPRRRANMLSDDEVLSIRRALSTVIRTAVRVGADKSRFPKKWLFHVRWGKAAHAVTADGHSISHATVGGRTTAWVPTLQK